MAPLKLIPRQRVAVIKNEDKVFSKERVFNYKVKSFPLNQKLKACLLIANLGRSQDASTTHTHD